MIISRYHNTKQLRIGVEFLTPCFLGGADQNAELRAAPFKNLLRQWWRVAVGSEYSDPKKMLEAEGELFGSALDDSKASASRVRVDLRPGDGFEIGQEELDVGQTLHPEVGAGGMKVSNALYLGFGPVEYDKATKHAKSKKYIAAGSKAELTLCLPKDCVPEMSLVLAYIDAFGTIGSRCRNGWGSLALSGNDLNRESWANFNAEDWHELVNGTRQYPTHLGKDDKGLLCWELKLPPKDWQAGMKVLAEIYMNLRTRINIAPNGLQKRHILGYPVTNHPVDTWGKKDGRMPSQLRLMVKRDSTNQLIARILHLPHSLPKPWNTTLGTESAVWQDIHGQLDNSPDFHRIQGGA